MCRVVLAIPSLPLSSRSLSVLFGLSFVAYFYCISFCLSFSPPFSFSLYLRGSNQIFGNFVSSTGWYKIKSYASYLLLASMLLVSPTNLGTLPQGVIHSLSLVYTLHLFRALTCARVLFPLSRSLFLHKGVLESLQLVTISL